LSGEKLLAIKKRDILRMLLKSRKGLCQAKEYNKKAKEFWKQKHEELTNEIVNILNSSTDLQLLKISQELVKKTNLTDLSCSISEIKELRKILKIFNTETVVSEFVNYCTRTGFLTVVIAPALAAAEGIGGVKEDAMNEWIYGIGICLPVSADVGDCIIDKEFYKHPLIPLNAWLTCHKLGSAIIFRIGLDHTKNIKTGDKILDKYIIARLEKGIKKVSEKQIMDFKAKEIPNLPESKLEEIYDGKICEIEATVFGTIPSPKKNIIKIFEEGARFFAGELQVVDDMEDLLGDSNLGKRPEIPNPSFFLTYCYEFWKEGKRDLKKIIEDALEKTLKKGQEYHENVAKQFEKLPKNFPTKPFFQLTLWYYNRLLMQRYNQVLKGRTYPEIRPQLLNMMKKG
jgi:hypothetical protein